MIDIGYSATSITSSDSFSPYTSVTVKTGDGSDALSYTASAEQNTGRNLEVIIPFGNAETARNILSKVNGYQYKPYSADGAVVNPAVEIGDSVSVAGTESSMFSQDITFGGVMKSNISAPGEEEIDHEIEYIPHERRTVNRAVGSVAGAVKDLDEKITTIIGDVEIFNGNLTIKDGFIVAQKAISTASTLYGKNLTLSDNYITLNTAGTGDMMGSKYGPIPITLASGQLFVLTRI